MGVGLNKLYVVANISKLTYLLSLFKGYRVAIVCGDYLI